MSKLQLLPSRRLRVSAALFPFRLTRLHDQRYLPRLIRLLLTCGLALACASCSVIVTPVDPASRVVAESAAPATTQPAQWFDHVVVIVLENQNYDAAVRDPYLKRLAEANASFTHFHALFHPSQPNYLAMVGGRLFEVDRRRGDANVDLPDDGRHRTIGDALESVGLTWKNYAESYPARPGSPPFLGAQSGRYARKHVPFLSFVSVQRRGADKIVAVDPSDPNNAFVTDARAGALPSYAFYSPNLDDDGHDPAGLPSIGLRKASAWLQEFLEKRFPPELRPRTLVVVTFDESQGNEATNHIYTVLIGDTLKPASPQRSAELAKPYNHYNLLRTIEMNFGLPPLSTGDAGARPITGIWK